MVVYDGLKPVIPVYIKVPHVGADDEFDLFKCRSLAHALDFLIDNEIEEFEIRTTPEFSDGEYTEVK